MKKTSEKIKEPEETIEKIVEEEEQIWIDCTVTAYCACIKCCGKTNGITASGTKAKANHTISADWRVFPCGTAIEIENIGTYVVEDRGSAVKGYKIDVFFNTCEEATNFGRQHLRIRVVE